MNTTDKPGFNRFDNPFEEGPMIRIGIGFEEQWDTAFCPQHKQWVATLLRRRGPNTTEICSISGHYLQHIKKTPASEAFFHRAEARKLGPNLELEP